MFKSAAMNASETIFIEEGDLDKYEEFACNKEALGRHSTLSPFMGGPGY